MKAFVMSFSALLALSFLACSSNGGGDGGASSGELTLQEYFRRVDGVFDDIERLSGDFDGAFSLFEPGASIEEQRRLTRGYFDEALPVVQQLVSGLEAIDPPGEASDEHRAFVDVYRDALGNAQDAAAGIEDASVDDLVGMLSDFVSELLEGTPVCSDLQQVADENEIDTNLNC